MFMILLVAFGVIACPAKLVGAVPMGTVFAYQGFLMDDKLKPVDGLHDFWFSVYDDPNAPADANRVAGPNAVSDVNVVAGYFRVELDFGSEVFTGDALWLETAVRESGATTDPCDTLRPRMRVTLSPYAIYADMAGEVLGGIIGSGTVDRLAKFIIDTGTIGDSIIYEESGKIGIGEPLPSETLHVAGKGRIVDGSEGAGKVLTSDADGVATWQAIPPSSGCPSGVIVMWYGPVTAPPSGWVLCDGATHTASNGLPITTPDLRDRFVVGAGIEYDRNDTGGEKVHELTVDELPAHKHYH